MVERQVQRRGDLLSLLVGVLAVLGAALALLCAAGRLEVDPAVVLGGLVVAAGSVGLGAAVLSLRR